MTTTAFITHRECWLHDMGSFHPECPDRLGAINDRLIAAGLDLYLSFYDAPLATEEQILRAHDKNYFSELQNSVPDHGIRHLDPPVGRQAVRRRHVAHGRVVPRDRRR